MILGIILVVVGVVLETSRFAIAFMKGKEIFVGDMLIILGCILIILSLLRIGVNIL